MRTPVSVVTGYLGSGKTTLIASLLARADYRRQRGEEGRDFVLERFTWDRAAETIERELLRHAGNGRG